MGPRVGAGERQAQLQVITWPNVFVSHPLNRPPSQLLGPNTL